MDFRAISVTRFSWETQRFQGKPNGFRVLLDLTILGPAMHVYPEDDMPRDFLS